MEFQLKKAVIELINCNDEDSSSPSLSMYTSYTCMHASTVWVSVSFIHSFIQWICDDLWIHE